MVEGCSAESKTVFYVDTTTLPNIRHAIRLATMESARFTRGYADDLLSLHGKTPEALRALWRDSKNRWRYRMDEKNKEIVSSPCEMDRRGYADCKDFTAYVSGVLQNMGIPHWQKIIFYDADERKGHIFNVATVAGEEYIVDPVYHKFNGTYRYRSATDMNGSAVGASGESSSFTLAAIAVAALAWFYLKGTQK